MGGETAKMGAWPWIVSIYEEGMVRCGGMIISEEYILTAAHCFEQQDPAKFSIVVGDHVVMTDVESSHGVEHKFDRIWIHKKYNKYPINSYEIDPAAPFDIALVKIRGKIKFTNYVQPICLPEQDERFSTYKEYKLACYAAGWGDTNDFFTPLYTLQEIRQEIVPYKRCKGQWGTNIVTNKMAVTRNMICFGRAGKGTCVGDSGGPLMCKRPDEDWKLAGVTSWGDMACNYNPSVFTKVSKFVNWIRDIIKAAGTSDDFASY